MSITCADIPTTDGASSRQQFLRYVSHGSFCSTTPNPSAVKLSVWRSILGDYPFACTRIGTKSNLFFLCIEFISTKFTLLNNMIIFLLAIIHLFKCPTAGTGTETPSFDRRFPTFHRLSAQLARLYSPALFVVAFLGTKLSIARYQAFGFNKWFSTGLTD